MNALYIIIGILVLLFVGRKFFLSGSQNEIKEVNQAEAKQLLAKGSIALDVRTPAEVAQGKIKGSKNINVTSPDFKSKIDALDKSKSYVVYCRSGRRSMNACNIMQNKGFENVVNLRGGFNAWK